MTNDTSPEAAPEAKPYMPAKPPRLRASWLMRRHMRIGANHHNSSRNLARDYEEYLFDHLISRIAAPAIVAMSTDSINAYHLELADVAAAIGGRIISTYSPCLADSDLERDPEANNRIRHAIIKVRGGFVSIAVNTGMQEGIKLDNFIIRIVNKSQARATALAAKLKGLLQPLAHQPAPERAKLRVWHHTGSSVTSGQITIEAPDLAEARANYPQPVGEALTALIDNVRSLQQGVHVWYGPPGTGKTTALRVLTQELQSDAVVHLIIDPEQLLKGGAGYMMSLLGSCSDPKKAYVIALEDAGQLITVDAGQRHSEALGRVLNLVDGVVGQNANVSILVTTNEPISKLHPALLRPGRCGSQVDFRPFTRPEAKAWLLAKGRPDLAGELERENTLADLYALINGLNSAPVRTVSERRPIGFVINE